MDHGTPVALGAIAELPPVLHRIAVRIDGLRGVERDGIAVRQRLHPGIRLRTLVGPPASGGQQERHRSPAIVGDGERRVVRHLLAPGEQDCRHGAPLLRIDLHGGCLPIPLSRSRQRLRPEGRYERDLAIGRIEIADRQALASAGTRKRSSASERLSGIRTVGRSARTSSPGGSRLR